MQTMPSTNYLDPAYNLAQTVFPFNSFTAKKLGLQLPQTSLKIESYNLACVPIRTSLQQMTLMGSFSKDELGFFQRFKGTMAGLSLVFQPGNSQQYLKIFCRCVVLEIASMKGRESVGLIIVHFKPCPPDLVTLLGDYLMLMERLKQEFEATKGKIIPMSPSNAKLMGFNNYATLSSKTDSIKLAIFSLAVDRIEFLVPMKSPDLPMGMQATIKLFFQKYQFSVEGTIIQTNRMPTGVQRIIMSIGFMPELMELLDEFWFAERVQNRPKT